jgi:ABC-2 type transport system ATP-binding protein
MIKLEQLNKFYGSFHAVKDLTLEIPRGEIFCFLGPNGAGKTTTLKMLTGLLHPSSGRAWIGGLDIEKDPLEAKKKIAYIPDTPFLYDRLTATEFFTFMGTLYGMDRASIEAEYERSFSFFGLMDHRATLCKDLSHGLRQRLVYAASFLHKPEVLFIDEPLIGLDPLTIRTIKTLLRESANNGMTIFLTTHILSLAEDVADRIGIILGGRLIALGTLNEIQANSGATGDLENVFLTLTQNSET